MTVQGGSLAIRGRLLSFDADPRDEALGRAVRYIEDGLVVVEKGLIREVGEASDLLQRLRPDMTVVDHRPHLVLPGFIDPHLHMPQTQVIASYGAELMEWLAKYTFPEESRYGDPAVAASASRFLLDELLASGTTTAGVFCTSHPESVDAFFTEAAGRGMRMVAGKVMMDRNGPPALLDTPETGYQQSRDLIRRWHGKGRLSYAISPRFAPTSSEMQLEAAEALASEFPDMHIQTHLSENEAEIAFVREAFPWSKDYTEVYERYGLVREKAMFGHCIHLSVRERAALSAGGATAVFCPTSNLFLGSGLFDREAMREGGIRIGLATDIGGGTSYSMLRTAAEAYKVLALRGQKLPALEAFHMMTAGNAEAMGLDSRIGRLVPGHEADFVVLDSSATATMRRRMERVETLEEELFALMTLGDERATVATYVFGERAYERGTTRRPLPARQDHAPPDGAPDAGEPAQ
ncbi:guanine deaminase [Aurantimonas aggregata]|uniref:Guanine deaminase n=1 Tax=Aurantimonas aggregata TaxID=2047720 RepID=A0A6L9MIB9_9HYPH|nr:guanine deaminase [Aurantimonas aggregata]NDV87322.1 guanine deaminase [Aurantimonas aggregata]